MTTVPEVGIEPTSHALQAYAKTTSATPAWGCRGELNPHLLIHSQACRNRYTTTTMRGTWSVPSSLCQRLSILATANVRVRMVREEGLEPPISRFQSARGSRSATPWSGWPDLNRRSSAPEADAIPGFATPRYVFCCCTLAFEYDSLDTRT